MRQELIDLLLGELDAAEAEALRERLRSDPALAREMAQAESLFALLRRGEEIPAPDAIRAAVLERAKGLRPPILVRLRDLPGLVAYRFRNSARFRVAMLSLCAHLVLISVLAQVIFTAERRALTVPEVTFVAEDLPPIEPSRSLVSRLELRRVSHTARLRQIGAPGQEETIRQGIENLLARQRPDGSFGDTVETATASLALLAEGDCSTQATIRGLALRAARDHLLAAAERGERHGALLAALVEDYALAYEGLREEERALYARAIYRLVQDVSDADEFGGEALVLAGLAGFPVPAGRAVGEAAALVSGGRAEILSRPPTRLRATVVLARGPSSVDAERAREWAAPLFADAIAEVRAGRGSALALLTLQAPYRL